MLWVEGWAEHWQMMMTERYKTKRKKGRTKKPYSCGSTSQTHRRLQFYDKQINRLEIKISFRIICMFSVVTSFSDLYFTLVILTAYFEEEEVGGTPTPN